MKTQVYLLVASFLAGGFSVLACGSQPAEDPYDTLQALHRRAETTGHVSWRDAQHLITDRTVRSGLRGGAIEIVAKHGDAHARRSLLEYFTAGLSDETLTPEARLELVSNPLTSLIFIESDPKPIDATLAASIADLLQAVLPKGTAEMLAEGFEPLDRLVMRLGTNKPAQTKAAIALYRGSMAGGHLESSVYLPQSFFFELQADLAHSIDHPDPHNRFDLKAARALAAHGFMPALPVFHQALAAVERDLIAARRGTQPPGVLILGSVKGLENVRKRMQTLTDLLSAHHSVDALLEFADRQHDYLIAYGFSAMLAAERMGASLDRIRAVLEAERTRIEAAHDPRTARVELSGIKRAAIEEGWLSERDWPDVPVSFQELFGR